MIRTFFLGFSLGAIAGLLGKSLIRKNKEDIIKIMECLPKPIKIEPGTSLKKNRKEIQETNREI